MKALFALLLASSFAFSAYAEEAAPNQNQADSLDELLEMVKQGTLEDQQELQSREATFKRKRDEQARLLKEAQAELKRQEQRSVELEQQFDNNKKTIREDQQVLSDKLGSLKELFGIFQQTAGDLQGVFFNSATSIQYPSRGEFLEAFAKKMSKASEISTIEEVERLWFELQREMTETGKVVRFNAPVLGADGRESKREVIRLGGFGLITNDPSPAYLAWRAEVQKLAELKRQPTGNALGQIEDYAESEESYAGLAVDPTGGALLSRLVDSPTLAERVQQGGLVGYIILAVGAFALLLAAYKLVTINITAVKVAAQKRDVANPQSNNPLGRVLQVYNSSKSLDIESLEMRLAEAILDEMPRINRFIVILKIISVVAPLMGLLGTVTGMINTFQAITLFGTGDPKTMAGGISQALVTTVLGLVVAIPTVVLHTIVASRAKSINHTLEHQAAGLIAEQMEAKHESD
jgi:biopolymer transport protein ExbB